MKKLAILVGVAAILAWGTGVWATTQDTMGSWIVSQDNGLGYTANSSFSGLSVVFTDLSDGDVELTITSTLTNSAYSWAAFIFNFVSPTGNGVLTLVSPPSSDEINSVSVNGTWPVYPPPGGGSFPWPPGGGKGLGIGTADVMISASSGSLLAYNGTLSLELASNVPITSSDFNYSFETSSGTLQSPARYFGAILAETGTTSEDGIVAESSNVSTVPIPPSVLVLAGGLGGLGLIRRRKVKK